MDTLLLWLKSTTFAIWLSYTNFLKNFLPKLIWIVSWVYERATSHFFQKRLPLYNTLRDIREEARVNLEHIGFNNTRIKSISPWVQTILYTPKYENWKSMTRNQVEQDIFASMNIILHSHILNMKVGAHRFYNMV